MSSQASFRGASRRIDAARRCRGAAGAVVLAALLSACAGTGPSVYSQERFDAEGLHARRYAEPAAQVCEAARRALLGNGYLVQQASAQGVDGRKRFQPSPDAHVEIEFHVTCVAESDRNTTVFANALQDRYALKKTSNSASLGVGPVGSVSLPFGSSSDSLVKIASETIPSADFYDRFFALVERHLWSLPE